MAHRDLRHVEILHDPAENAPQISDRIKFSEIVPIARMLIAFAEKLFGATEPVSASLIEDPCDPPSPLVGSMTFTARFSVICRK